METVMFVSEESTLLINLLTCLCLGMQKIIKKIKSCMYPNQCPTTQDVDAIVETTEEKQDLGMPENTLQCNLQERL